MITSNSLDRASCSPRHDPFGESRGARKTMGCRPPERGQPAAKVVRKRTGPFPYHAALPETHVQIVPVVNGHTLIAFVGVVVLSLRGCWIFRPCPRTYLHPPGLPKQGPFPPECIHPFPGTMGPSHSLLAPYDFGLSLIRTVFVRRRLPGRVSRVP